MDYVFVDFGLCINVSGLLSLLCGRVRSWLPSSLYSRFEVDALLKGTRVLCVEKVRGDFSFSLCNFHARLVLMQKERCWARVI